MFSLVSSKFLAMRNISLYSVLPLFQGSNTSLKYFVINSTGKGSIQFLPIEFVGNLYNSVQNRFVFLISRCQAKW